MMKQPVVASSLNGNHCAGEGATEALIQMLEAYGSALPERTAKLLRQYELDVTELLELDIAGWEALGFTDPLQRNKLMFLIRRHINTPNALHVAQRVPIANFAYDLMYGDYPPTTPQIEALCTTMSVVAALFLSIITALPDTVGIDDIEQALERFSQPPYDAYEYGPSVVTELVLFTSLSMYGLGACLLSSIMLLICMFITQNVDNEVKDESTARSRERGGRAGRKMGGGRKGGLI